MGSGQSRLGCPAEQEAQFRQTASSLLAARNRDAVPELERRLREIAEGDVQSAAHSAAPLVNTYQCLHTKKRDTMCAQTLLGSSWRKGVRSGRRSSE